LRVSEEGSISSLASAVMFGSAMGITAGEVGEIGEG
jgi:hypothetical protein